MKINCFSLFLIFTMPSLASDMNLTFDIQEPTNDPLNNLASFFSEQEINQQSYDHELQKQLKKVFNFTDKDSPGIFLIICPYCPEKCKDQCSSDNPYAPKRWYKKHLKLYHQNQEFTEQDFQNNLTQPEEIQQFSIECPVCRFQFNNAYIRHRLIPTLRTHIRKVHPDEQYSDKFFENYKANCQKIFIPNPKKK